MSKSRRSQRSAGRNTNNYEYKKEVSCKDNYLSMYLDYESFVDCLIKSGYTKKCSDLMTEMWSSGTDHFEIIIDCTTIVTGKQIGRAHV